MPRSLDLSIDQFSLKLTVFAEGGYERMIAALGDVEYSLNGCSIETGQLHESKFVWTVAAYVSAEQWRQLWALYQRSERKRRSQIPYAILLDDYIENYVEDGLRSRALAPSGTVTTGNGYVSYPARFGVRMFEPKSESVKNLMYPYIARFVLKELDRLL